MAQHASAKKRIRQTKRRTQVNQRRLSTVRTYIRKVEAAIQSGNKAEAEAALKAAEPHMIRGARKGVMHRNTLARKLSRLSKQIKAMAA
ncbi:MAG: 30S ribosomal protein S20 [Rhodospirillales bacterium]